MQRDRLDARVFGSLLGHPVLRCEG
jgi:hypothetical protein